MTKRIRERSPAPSIRPAAVADTSAELEDTRSVEDDESSDADEVPVQAWLHQAVDPGLCEVERCERIERCLNVLESTGKRGPLALGKLHWELFEAITLLAQPGHLARRFAGKFLANADSPRHPSAWERHAGAVGALRSALALISLHRTPHALNAIVGKVLYVARSSNLSVFRSRELLGIAFRGRETQVGAVFDACCKSFDRQGAYSKLTCAASLAALGHLGGLDQQDLDRAATALGGSDETQGKTARCMLQLFIEVLKAFEALRAGPVQELGPVLTSLGESFDQLSKVQEFDPTVRRVVLWVHGTLSLFHDELISRASIERQMLESEIRREIEVAT